MKLDVLKELLSYNPETGLFVWLKNRGRLAKCGSVAGSLDTHGYLHITISGKIYLSHRLAFLFMTGEFPIDCVDHINRVRTDNRWCNLRDATKRQNSNNKNNGNKYVGVTKFGNRYQASIKKRVNGINTTTHLGMFGNPEEATKAYQLAKSIYIQSINL